MMEQLLIIKQKFIRIIGLLILSIVLSACGDPPASVDLGAGFNKARGLNAEVQIIVAANDGSGDIYVGGDFVTYSNTMVNGLARFNSDGSIDSAFDTQSSGGFNDKVQSIALATDGSGDVYVGGSFSSYNGTVASRLVRLNSDGSVDNAFNTQGGFNNAVMSIAPATDGSGDVYVGGSFVRYNSAPVAKLVRLNSDGSVDNAFNTQSGLFNNDVRSIVPATDGSGGVYVGGYFTTYLVRLNSDGSVDSVFDIQTGVGFNNVVMSIALATDGSGDVYVGGGFTNYNGLVVNRLVRLNSNGSVDSAFDVQTGGGFDGTVQSLTLAKDGSGDVYVGGYFNIYNGATANRLVRLNNDGSVDIAFDTQPSAGFNIIVMSITQAIDDSSDVYVGGYFTTYKGTGATGLVRLNSDGSVESDFSTLTSGGFKGPVFSLALAADGSRDVYVGGSFSSYNGTVASHLVRLNSDGSVDNAFNIQGGFNNAVMSIAPATDGTGDVYVGGGFTTYNGVGVNRLVRLNSDGSVDATFDTQTGGGFNNAVMSIAPATDGSGDVYVGGYFTTYNGVVINRLVRLNSDGSLDGTFDTETGGGFDAAIKSLALASDGSGDVYVGGYFTSYNGVGINRLVRLNSDGSVDSAFNIQGGFNNIVESIALAIDGSGDVYVGGYFTTYNGAGVTKLVRLNSDGSVESTFDAQSGGGYNGAVMSILIDTDGSNDVYVGGYFTTYKGTGANRLVRLNSDGSVESAFATQTRGSFGTNSAIFSIVLATDGSKDVYVGGGLTSHQGTTVANIMRLDPDGSVD